MNEIYLMRGIYPVSYGGYSEEIKKDTIIKEIIESENYFYVKIDGISRSLLVYDENKILKKRRERNVVFRKKPCHCQRFGWGKTEWMAGVPMYCKGSYKGGSCPLIKNICEKGVSLFYCNYEKGLIKDYISVCNINEIEIEKIKILL